MKTDQITAVGYDEPSRLVIIHIFLGSIELNTTLRLRREDAHALYRTLQDVLIETAHIANEKSPGN